jgi:SulP family sulfate permease
MANETAIGPRRPFRKAVLDIHPPAVQDLVAGASVAFVLIPQSLAYAQLAGMPAYRGLLAAAVPPLVAAPFASSRYLQPGPTAITALLTFATLAPLAPPGSASYVGLALLLALMVGLVRLLVGMLRAGVVSYLLSQPLVIGFVPGAAILIIASQLPVALGVSTEGRDVLPAAARALAHAGSWQAAPVLIAVLASASMLLARRVSPLVPGVLLAVAGATIYSALAGYDGPIVGHLPSRLPSFSVALPWHEAPRLVVGAVVIALLGFAEAASIARTYAAIDRDRWNPNREFVSQGVANVAAAFTGGFPVGASFSRSALNRLAGARTTASGFVTGLVVLLLLPLGFLLERLPQSVLAATVIVAVVPLVRVDRIVRVVGWSRPQGAIAVLTFAMTLALEPHVEWALIAGISLSIAIHLWKELTLEVRAERCGTTLELRPIGVLWFATARGLEDRFLDLLAGHPETRRLAIRLDGLGRIDLTGALALQTLRNDARAAGVAVEISGAPPQARRVLERVLGPMARGDREGVAAGATTFEVVGGTDVA